MNDPRRIAGTVEVAYNGNVIKVTGNISYNLGRMKRETKKGPDSIHGYSEMPQEPFIEGECRLTSETSLTELVDVTNATVTAILATNKTVMLTEAWFEGEGTAGSEEGSVPFKFCGTNCEEIA